MAILFADLRGSTERAKTLGARKTHVTMHGLIPTLVSVTASEGRYVSGLRGDGPFSAFGIDAVGKEVGDLPKAVQSASRTGKIMCEAVEGILSAALEQRVIGGGLVLGTGVDVGDVLVTRIGLGAAFDTTACGDAVNNSEKSSKKSSGAVLISHHADSVYPQSPNGRVRTVPIGASEKSVKLIFPEALLSHQKCFAAGWR